MTSNLDQPENTSAITGTPPSIYRNRDVKHQADQYRLFVGRAGFEPAAEGFCGH